MNNNIISLFIALYLFHFFKVYKQISENTFFQNYVDNTTQIDLYDNSTAYIYLNNKTRADMFINIPDQNDFLNKMKKANFELLYKRSFNFEPYIMMIGLGVFLMWRSGGMTSFVGKEEKINIKLENVAGLDYNKKEIFEFVDFLKNRDKYIKIGARMPRGALFHGPPGTGKTLLAKAVAGECGIPFLSAAGSDFSQMFVGVGAARIRNLFQEARKKAPCIVFIDEIDALARKRSSCGLSGSAERDNTLNRFLVELDGFAENDNILLFAATNRMDILDKALLRPGRFDRKIQFELPEKNDREKIFEYYLNKVPLEDDLKELSQYFARISTGFSCADIANICNEASILCVRRKKKKVTKQLLEDALDNVILGPEKKSFRLSEKERKIVAYHEAGHATINYILSKEMPPIKVSIMPRGKSALGFSQSNAKEGKLMSKQEMLNKMCILLGGRVSEEIFIKSITTGAADDIQKLTDIVYKYIGIFGMNDEFGPMHYKKDYFGEKASDNVDKIAKEMIDSSYDEAKTILKKNKKYVKSIASELLEKETLYKEDLDRIFADMI